MGKELWLSRDNTNSGQYNIHIEEPLIDRIGLFCDYVTYFTTEEFHYLFPIRLRKGRKKRIKRILIELEDR